MFGKMLFDASKLWYVIVSSLMEGLYPIMLKFGVDIDVYIQSVHIYIYVVWYGMVWYGMVRYGMVWYGTIK